jgi:hypothetical protein
MESKMECRTRHRERAWRGVPRVVAVVAAVAVLAFVGVSQTAYGIAADPAAAEGGRPGWFLCALMVASGGLALSTLLPTGVIAGTMMLAVAAQVCG